MWHRCPVRLPSPHLEIESVGKVCLKQMGGKSKDFSACSVCRIKHYWSVLAHYQCTFQIDIDSKNHTVDICGLRQLEWWVISCLCLYFRCCSDCFLPEHAALLEGTGQVGAYRAAAWNLCLIPHACFCSSVLQFLLNWEEMVLLAHSTIPTLAAPVPPALKDCSKRFVRETAGLADADMLQQRTVAVLAEGVCER